MQLSDDIVYLKGVGPARAKVLAAELDGYTDYMKRVKYRLIPYIW